ncbi:MAG: DUF1269 domain-containing protein, partial [Bdellovibrionales bacterium]|nr:DUF1269 domain-containing protein [Bdellovibrionales bacterium]
LLHEETPDRVREELKDLKAQVLHTSLRKTDEIKLRKALESARKDRAATKSDKPERQAEEAGKDTARKSKSA